MSNFVQKVACTPSVGGTAISGTITGVTAGHTLFFVTGYYQNPSATPPAAPSDTNGTFTVGFTPTPSTDGLNNHIAGAVYVELVAAAGTHVCSLPLPAGGNSFGFAEIFEFSNVTSATADQTNQTNTTSAISSSVSSGALAQATEIAFAVLATVTTTGVVNAGITDPPTGFTSGQVADDTATNIGVEIAYKETAATTALTAAYTWTDANSGGGDTLVSQSSISTYRASGAAAAPFTPFTQNQFFVNDVQVQT